MNAIFGVAATFGTMAVIAFAALAIYLLWARMADQYPYQGLAGFSTADTTSERQAIWGGSTWYLLKGVQILSSAADAGNSPTTQLRHGLLMGLVAASGNATNYAPNAADGSNVVAGFLWEQRNTLDSSGTAVNRIGQLVVCGSVQASQLLLLDEQARRQMQGRFIFDDRLAGTIGGYRQTIAKTSNYQVVNGTDNDTHFTTTGNAGAITFTLPATIQKGQRWRFTNTVGQNMTVTAASGKLVAFNNAAATSVTFSTAGQLIGGTFEIVVDETSAKYLAIPSGSNTVTVA